MRGKLAICLPATPSDSSVVRDTSFISVHHQMDWNDRSILRLNPYRSRVNSFVDNYERGRIARSVACRLRHGLFWISAAPKPCRNVELPTQAAIKHGQSVESKRGNFSLALGLNLDKQPEKRLTSGGTRHYHMHRTIVLVHLVMNRHERSIAYDRRAKEASEQARG